MTEFLRWGSWALLGLVLVSVIPTIEELLPVAVELTQNRTVVDLNGEARALFAPDSSTLIIVVADWCPASRKFLANTTSRKDLPSAEVSALRLLVMGTNEDGAVHLSRLAPWARPVLHDKTGRLAKALGVGAVPTVLLVENGTVKWSRQAGDGSIPPTNLATQ